MKSIVVGLTGGIGTGKTTVLKLFEELGAIGFITDLEAKKLMTLPEIKKKISALLGENAYLNGDLNRSFIAQKVFNNPDQLNALNHIIHPEVAKVFQQFVTSHKGNVILYESAILFNSANHDFCDWTIVVSSPLDLRIDRIQQRNMPLSHEEILTRIKNQPNQEWVEKKADFVIQNTNINETQKQVETIYQTICKGLGI